MFMVVDATLFQGGWVIDGVFVRDVDDGVDVVAVLFGEADGVVLLVDFAEHLERHEGVC